MNRTPIKRVSSGRALELAEYRKLARTFLEAHPLCQATLLELEIQEEHALSWWRDLGSYGERLKMPWKPRTVTIPLSDEIHHRNKRNGPRLTDVRWFLAVSRYKHDWIEFNLAAARLRGWSLDISANPDGLTPGGQQGLTTEQLFAKIPA